MSFLRHRWNEYFSANTCIVRLLILVIAYNVSIVEAEGTADYIHYRLGVKYKNEKKYDRAINEFRKVIAAYPDNYNAYLYMAEIRNEQKKHRLVIYNLKKALSYNPGWSRAQKMLAAAYEKNGQYQKAIIELQQYQQTGDPADRDSVQQEIDRLIKKVSKSSQSEEETQKVEDSIITNTGVDDSAVKMKSTGSVKRVRKVTTAKKKSQPGIKKTVSEEELFTHAVELYNKEKFNQSLVYLNKVLKINSSHEGAYYYAGLIRYRKKEYRRAIINLRRGMKYAEFGQNAHYYLGKIFGEQKNYATAITHLFKYIETSTYEPGKKEAAQLIEKYRRAGGAAVLDAIAPGPRLPGLLSDSASPREQYFVLEVRVDSLLTMVTVDTLSDPGRKLLNGIHAFTEGKYDDAILEFKKVLSENPSGTIAIHCLYNIGICYLKMRLFRSAHNQFQQILDRAPNHTLSANSLFLMALASLEQSEPSIAEKLLRKFIRNNRKHPWIANAYEKLGDAYLDSEQTKKAVDAYKQAVAVSIKMGDKVAMLFKLGNAYQMIENRTRAIETFLAVIKNGEKAGLFLRIPDSYYQIADTFYKMKQYKKALNYYVKVTRKYPSYQETPWGLFQIGSVYKNLKNYSGAMKAFKELIKKYPDDYWTRQAQWKMEDVIWENEYKAVLK